MSVSAQEADSWKFGLSNYMEFGDLFVPVAPTKTCFQAPDCFEKTSEVLFLRHVRNILT
jgi:hypothetical protein